MKNIALQVLVLLLPCITINSHAQSEGVMVAISQSHNILRYDGNGNNMSVISTHQRNGMSPCFSQPYKTSDSTALLLFSNYGKPSIAQYNCNTRSIDIIATSPHRFNNITFSDLINIGS